MSDEQLIQLRVDKWLWVARFFKTRQIAADAVKGGHVEVNGARAKPARMVCAGDRLSIRKGPFTFEVRVERLRERRVSAKEAQTLYREFDASIERREKLKLQLKSQAQQILYDPKKPSLRERRHARRRKRDDN